MFRLTFFILVALALHTLAYLELAPRLAAKEPRTTRTTVVPVRLAAKREAERTTPPPVSPPIAKAKTNPAPKKPEPNKEVPLPKLTRHADKAGPDQGSKKSEPEPKAKGKVAPKSTPKPKATGVEAPKPKAKAAPNNATPKPAAHPKRPHDFRSRDDYFRRVTRLADRAPRAGWAVPDLVTDDGLSFAEMRDILHFYGCKVVAYPLPRGGAPSFFLELGGKGLDRIVRREGKNMLEGYSSRARDLTDQPGFWKVLSRVASAHQLDPYHACIAAVVPERVDRYFLYMQDRAARSAGLPLDALRSTRGRFRRTNVGWTLEIYEVTPRQGRPVPVKMDKS